MHHLSMGEALTEVKTIRRIENTSATMGKKCTSEKCTSENVNDLENREAWSNHRF